MAKKKTSPKKKPKNKTSRKKPAAKPVPLLPQLARGFLGLGILTLAVFITGFVFRFIVPPKEPVPHIQTIKTKVLDTLGKNNSEAKPPVYEIYPKETPAKPVTGPPAKDPKIALIIDDIGYNRRIADKLLTLDAKLTFSILPGTPYNKSIAEKAFKNGTEIMLHLPMEPFEYPEVNPGPGALLTSMSPDILIRQLKENLNVSPYIKGVNNHMGSKMTTISTQLYQIFTVLKKKDLYFIDSATTNQSLCKPSARLLKIPFAQRDAFLDHNQNREDIIKQLNYLVRLAKRHGRAVGIGHPYNITYEVLQEMIPQIKKQVKIVPASEIVAIPE